MDYEEFKKSLKKNNLTQKKFSELSGIKYSTCTKWGKDNRPVSDWVESWLNLYEKNQHLENDKIDDEEYQELLQLRKSFQVLLSKGKYEVKTEK